MSTIDVNIEVIDSATLIPPIVNDLVTIQSVHSDDKITTPSTDTFVTSKRIRISIRNDGKGLPVKLSTNEEGIYIPELILGNLLTGSNFNDNEVNDNMYILVGVQFFFVFVSSWVLHVTIKLYA